MFKAIKSNIYQCELQDKRPCSENICCGSSACNLNSFEVISVTNNLSSFLALNLNHVSLLWSCFTRFQPKIPKSCILKVQDYFKRRKKARKEKRKGKQGREKRR